MLSTVCFCSLSIDNRQVLLLQQLNGCGKLNAFTEGKTSPDINASSSTIERLKLKGRILIFSRIAGVCIFVSCFLTVHQVTKNETADIYNN